MFNKYVKNQYLVLSAFPNNREHNFIGIVGMGKGLSEEALVNQTLKVLSYEVETIFDFDRVKRFRNLDVEIGILNAPKKIKQKLMDEYTKDIMWQIEHSKYILRHEKDYVPIVEKEYRGIKISIAKIAKKNIDNLKYLTKQWRKSNQNLYYFHTIYGLYADIAIRLDFTDFLKYYMFDLNRADLLEEGLDNNNEPVNPPLRPMGLEMISDSWDRKKRKRK
jgi:hypothetical protein